MINKSDNIILRLAGSEDRERWIELNKAFMDFEIQDGELWDNPNQLSDEKLASTFDEAVNMPDHSALFIFENKDSEIIGFANLMIIFSVWASGTGIIIDDLYIEEKYRGLGYGRETMKLIESYAIDKGHRRLQFLSEETNEEAYNFYTHLGYHSENMKFYIKHFK